MFGLSILCGTESGGKVIGRRIGCGSLWGGGRRDRGGGGGRVDRRVGEMKGGDKVNVGAGGVVGKVSGSAGG